MRRPLLIVAAIAALVLAAVALAGRSSNGTQPARARPPFPVGFNESLAQSHHAADQAAWARLIDLDARLHHDAGSTILRTPLHWDATEPAPGRFDFSVPDALVAGYGARGVRLLFVLDGVPRWAGRGLGPWRVFVDAIAARYRGRIVGVDVLNEPNFDRVPIAPRRYVRLLCAAYAAVARRVPVGGGALATGPTLAPYLTAMLRAGAGRCMDALSFPRIPTPRT